jgi:iron complex outermembrane recepter protein
MLLFFRSILVFILLLFLCSSFIYGKEISVRIKVIGSKNELVSFSSVAIISRDDSTKRLSTITDETAVARFDLETAGQYFVNITAINYKPLLKGIIVTDSSYEFVLSLEPSTATLNEVVIQAAKPLMRQEDDKTIIDPESLAAASTSGYEVLEKTPGIFVDQDGNIYLNSTTPATVYINGREMKMSKSDIATMLKSLPPNSIDRIEIMRTPSAKYDASGSGGVVNVVLKKGVKIGFTGSLNSGFQQGKYGNQFGGINLSNNNGATSAYINLNYTHRNTYDVLNTDRFVSDSTLLSQQAYSTYPGNVYFMGYGINHELTNKWNLSYDGRISYNNSINETENNNTFKNTIKDSIYGSSLAKLKSDNTSFFVNQDIASTYKIDTLGSEWTNAFSYNYSSSSTDQLFNTQSVFPYEGDGTVNGKRHFISGQTDLVYKFPYKLTFETGLKSTFMSFKNNADYFLTMSSIRQQDESRTSQYTYKENINSAYVQGSKGLGSFLLKAGVRMENTNMNGRQFIPGDTSFTIHRTDFFPYVYFSRKVMTIAKYELRAYLVYRRTILRPTYEDLNPFPKYVDQFLSDVGNPTLRPQFSNNYEANVSIDERPLIAVGYNDTRDMFTKVFYQGGSNNEKAFRTIDNIGRNKEFYLRGFAAIPPGGVYFFVIGGQYNHNIYDGFYEGSPLSFKADSWLFFTYHQLKLDKNSQITLNGFMRLKGALQFYELSSFGALNVNINRKFFKQKLTVTLSCNDIFFTNNNKFTINQASVNASGYREQDTRRFGLNLRYNFGFHKREEEKDMFNMQP